MHHHGARLTPSSAQSALVRLAGNRAADVAVRLGLHPPDSVGAKSPSMRVFSTRGSIASVRE